MASHLPARLKHHREERGLSQSALARLLEVDSTTVSGWESGRRTPSVTTLDEIAQVLKIHIVNLFLPVTGSGD